MEEIYAFLDQKVDRFPGLAEKVDIGDSWCNPTLALPPAPTRNGYDLFVLHITNRSIPGPKPVFWPTPASTAARSPRPKSPCATSTGC